MMDKYTYKVTWSEEDEEYLGLCAEFPALSWLDKNKTQTFVGIQNLVQEVLNDMQETCETPPVPLSQKNYSGKFMVRVTPDTHRKLAIEAAEAGVSLNRLASARLG